MPFKTTAETPARQLELGMLRAAQLKAAATNFRDQAVAGSVNTADLHSGFVVQLAQTRADLIVARDTPGIGPYAKDQFNDQLYDIAAEFTAMMAEIDSIATWMEANFPKQVSGHLELVTFVGDGSGSTVSDTITGGGQLTALITELNALIATID